MRLPTPSKSSTVCGDGSRAPRSWKRRWRYVQHVRHFATPLRPHPRALLGNQALRKQLASGGGAAAKPAVIARLPSGAPVHMYAVPSNADAAPKMAASAARERANALVENDDKAVFVVRSAACWPCGRRVLLCA